MTDSRAIRWIVLFLLLVGTAGCDQATKHLARTRLSRTGSVRFPGAFFQLTLADNPGAFLGLGASLPQTARSGLTVALGGGLAFLLVYLARTHTLRLVPFLALSLVAAGGVSNLLDRLWRDGLVTDFMVLRAGPFHSGVFNLADFAIVVGALILVASLGSGKDPLGESLSRPNKPT